MMHQSFLFKSQCTIMMLVPQQSGVFVFVAYGEFKWSGSRKSPTATALLDLTAERSLKTEKKMNDPGIELIVIPNTFLPVLDF